MAHAEGRLATTLEDVRARLERGDGVALVYTGPNGETAERFPENPNGSVFAIAGLTNPAGNVLALMPHPERASWQHQVPRHVGGDWGRGRDRLDRESLFAPGPGAGFFTSLRKVL